MTDTAPRHDWTRLPPAGTGQRIGIFGGSFNPVHSGHVHVCLTALKRLRLDAVWWLVTPGNPLKDHDELAPLAQRVAAARAACPHPRVHVSGWEASLGTGYTARTLENLALRRPDLRLVWIMGSDNIAGFHKWQDWRGIARRVPIAVVERPGSTLSVLGAPFALTYGRFRVREENAAALALMRPPAWMLLHAPRDPASSTQLRRAKATS